MNVVPMQTGLSMKRPGFAEARLRPWRVVVVLAAAACSACMGPSIQAPEVQRPVVDEAWRKQQATVEAARQEQEAERAAAARKQAEALAEEKRRKLNALPAFRSQLKTGDRVKSSSGYMLGTVVELRSPLALVQLEIVEFPNRRYEMRWLPIDDLVQPEL